MNDPWLRRFLGFSQLMVIGEKSCHSTSSLCDESVEILYCGWKSRKLSDWSNGFLCFLWSVITKMFCDFTHVEKITPISKIFKKEAEVIKFSCHTSCFKEKGKRGKQYRAESLECLEYHTNHNAVDLEINSLWKCQSKLMLKL